MFTVGLLSVTSMELSGGFAIYGTGNSNVTIVYIAFRFGVTVGITCIIYVGRILPLDHSLGTIAVIYHVSVVQ